MESKWAKAKKALGLNLCVYAPMTLDESSPSDYIDGRSLDSVDFCTKSAQLTKSGSRTFKVCYLKSSERSMQFPELSLYLTVSDADNSAEKTCAICLGSMKPGLGHALFTAECSHTFHFNCITLNVKHWNHICPVCRAKWKEIPFQGPPLPDQAHGRTRVNPLNLPNGDPVTGILRQNSRAYYSNRHAFQRTEPSVFYDDEPLELHRESALDLSHGCNETVEIKAYPEFSAIEQSVSTENFAILVHLKAPLSTASQSSRSPIDLVTILDVSGSMTGTKIALLKRAMGFVIQNLGPNDRLSVVTFSTYAHRLFHLRRMSESGRQLALEAVNSLTCHGGTNIADGLKKGAKVIHERMEKNPVCSAMLLSDGQDTHPNSPDYSLMPHSTPVHSFGFGEDHDSVSMHAISESSGGTFSYIETEGVIQDAFAQCIGGLLSMVVQEMDVVAESAHPGVRIGAIKSGSYTSTVSADGRSGSIRVGDLYAEEERDFLVSINVPPSEEEISTSLLRVGCTYRDLASNDIVQLGSEEVKIQRPVSVTEKSSLIEVDRERNRVLATEAMAEARAAAERGALREAAAILEARRRSLSQSEAWRAGDRLCRSLDAELKEIQDRMTSQHQYDVSGRAYVLSGLSSHLWQRATARGDSTETHSLVQAYQTPSMVEMLQRSQTMVMPSREAHPAAIQPARSFNRRQGPR